MCSRLILPAIAFLLSAMLLHAQSTGESLLIHAGDMLHVQVFDTPELEQRVRVPDSGAIALELIGEINVAGQSPAEAAALIRKALISGGYMLRPQVSVLVESYASENVSVLGQVKAPGTYSILAPRSILDVIAMAGGLTEIADRNITIERKSDFGHAVEYFLANKSKEALKDQAMVYPGDRVLVPKAGLVYVLGDVGRPGAYVMQGNSSEISVLQAIAFAAGTNKTAMPAKARLVRKTQAGSVEIPLALSDMQKGKIPDLPLQANDVIYVPFSYMKNVAVGSSVILASASSAAIYAAP